MNKELTLTSFDYNLPPELIAQKPISPRDHSRLLVLQKKIKNTKCPIGHSVSNKKIEHKHFYNIVDYLKKGDVLVMNNSKVFPARLIGKKKNTEGKIEIFLHHKLENNKWQCLVGGRRIKQGLEIQFDNLLQCKIDKNNNDGTWDVLFNKEGKEMMNIVNKIGQTPLPPYIKREKQNKDDKKLYQTVYADKLKTGSVAAPTAGLHFTKDLLKKIKVKGIKIEYTTLHVGLGTFAPVKTDDIKNHKMHSEFVEIKKDTIQTIDNAKKNGKKIITVGTTSTRALESFYTNPKNYKPNLSLSNGLQSTIYSSWTDIFIYPGYKFKIVDAMITNFHLPKSTLLMLISALAGKKNIDKAYQCAIKEKYRFYSYGDAMLII